MLRKEHWLKNIYFKPIERERESFNPNHKTVLKLIIHSTQPELKTTGTVTEKTENRNIKT